MHDELTANLLRLINRSPGDLQTASEWAYSFSGATAAKAKTRLEKLAATGQIQKVVHDSPRRIYYGKKDGE